LHQRRKIFGKSVFKRFVICHQNFGNAGNRGGGLGNIAGLITCNKNMHLATNLAGGADSV